LILHLYFSFPLHLYEVILSPPNANTRGSVITCEFLYKCICYFTSCYNTW